jgi:peptidoglycan/LPS O-acetylase OafA/YrhL
MLVVSISFKEPDGKDALKGAAHEKNQALNKVIFFLFTVMFFSETFFLSQHSDLITKMPAPTMIAAGFACSFIGHAISFYGIGEWIRSWFTHQDIDASGAGEGPDPNEGWLNVLGQLVCCPICAGIWGTTLLLTIYSFIPSWGTILLDVMGSGGFAALMHWACEKIEWGR